MMNTAVKKIFVTGAAGFVGRHLLTDPLAGEYHFYVLCRKQVPAFFEGLKNITVLRGELDHFSRVADAIAGCDYFIHNAAEKNDEKKMYAVNVKGTKAVLEEIVKYPGIKFLLVSSAGVYAIHRHPEINITEFSPCFPDNAYEHTKLQAEELLKKYAAAHSLSYCIIRPSNVFGEYDKGRKLLNLFRSLQKGNFFYLDKNAMVNYVYVKYLTAAIFEIIRSNSFSNKVYNINSPCSIEKFIEEIKCCLGISSRTRSLPAAMVKHAAAAGDFLPGKYQFINSIKYRELTNKKVYTNDRIKQVVPLNAERFLLEGLKNLVAYYRHETLL